jgi:hypothetical protein
MSKHPKPVLLTAQAFRDAIRQVNDRGLRWQTPHPVQAWLAAADRMAFELDRGLDIGDPRLPPSRDPAFQSFAEDIVAPAARLCRLSLSLQAAGCLGTAVDQEIRGLAQREHFLHSDYVLFVGTRLSVHGGAKVRVVRQRGKDGPAPDLELEEEQACIECRARGDAGRAPTEDLRDDFAHATRKFASYMSDKPGWSGVLALEMGFIGSPTLPDVGRVGPRHRVSTQDAREQFRQHPLVAAFLNTWFTVEARPSLGDRRAYDLEPNTASGLLYSRTSAPRIPSLTRSFWPWRLGSRRRAIRSAPDRKL